MQEAQPIHQLRDKLETARLAAIEAIASSEAPTQEELQNLAITQCALSAVTDELAQHRVKLGGGSEEALK